MDEKIFTDFDNYRMEKRRKISIMDSIIRNNDEFKDSEIDVLFRGYIILIYAFWEGSYKEIQKVFFLSLKQYSINDLPHTLKNTIVLDLSIEKREKSLKIGEITDYKTIKKIDSSIDEVLKKKLSEFDKDKNLEKHFKEQSNNPNYSKLEQLLKKYNLSLNNILKRLISEGSIPENFKEYLDFIIKSRNSIAHGMDRLDGHDNYERYINSKFLNCDKFITEKVSDFLRDITFYMDVLYNEIIREFKDKYMHVDEKVL